jgi:hypothetical protein
MHFQNFTDRLRKRHRFLELEVIINQHCLALHLEFAFLPGFVPDSK